jgi:polar amino acid transport system permease protein
MEILNDFFTIIRFLLEGLGVTVSVTLIALAVGFALGVTMAVLRVYGSRPLAAAAAVYSVVVRAVPVVVTIFILYFVIAEFIDLSPFLAGALALGFASGAYQSEIFRGALQSVAPGQMTAARAIGMSRLQAIRHIVLPQAVRLALPGWGNEATLVLKDSTLVIAVGVPEMLRRAQYVDANLRKPFLVYGTAALLYLLLTMITSYVLGRLEQRYRMLT